MYLVSSSALFVRSITLCVALVSLNAVQSWRVNIRRFTFSAVDGPVSCLLMWATENRAPADVLAHTLWYMCLRLCCVYTRAETAAPWNCHRLSDMSQWMSWNIQSGSSSPAVAAVCAVPAACAAPAVRVVPAACAAPGSPCPRRHLPWPGFFILPFCWGPGHVSCGFDLDFPDGQ